MNPPTHVHRALGPVTIERLFVRDGVQWAIVMNANDLTAFVPLDELSPQESLFEEAA